MGCFTISRDSAENSVQSLRAILATKQPPLSSPWTAKKILQRKLGFIITRKTLQARTRLLDTASHSLAKAKQRTLISLPAPSDNNINSNTTLFPLPLPPGYSSNTNININYLNSSSNHSRASPNPSLHSDSITSCHSSASDSCTPSSSTSSSVFSAAPSSSSSSNSSDLRCSSLSHIVDDHSFSIPLPLPSPNKVLDVAYLLREFPPHELARACENFNESHKLRDGAMGPVYRAILTTNAEQTSSVAIARVTTNMSRKIWKAQVQSLARVTHPNLCRIIGFSYERAKYGEGNGGNNTGFIVYENPGNESLDEFLQDVEKGHSHIDWSTRLKIAIGAAEGLAFLLERMPKQIMYGNFQMNNIQVDSLFNAKLSDMVVAWARDQHKDDSALDVHGFGLVLLQLFNFSSYPQDREPLDLEVNPQIKQPYPPKDAKLVIDLAASCLLPEASLRPSMRHVARALRSLEPSTRHVPKFLIKPPKSLTRTKRKSFSFS